MPASAGYMPVATTSEKGAVIADGLTVNVDGTGRISVPIATPSSLGVVEPDGVTIGVGSGGQIQAEAATLVSPGIMEPDGATLYVDQAGVESAVLATATTPGISRPDGSTIKITPTGVIYTLPGGITITDHLNTIDGVTELFLNSMNISGTSPHCSVFINLATATAAGIVAPDEATTYVDELGRIGVFQATPAARGIVRPDGTTTTVDGQGTISVPVATTQRLGVVQPDGVTLAMVPGLPHEIEALPATASSPGIVQPDDSTIHISPEAIISVPLLADDVIGVGKPDGVSIVASAPGLLTVPLATAGSPGLVEPDGTTIHVTGAGKISAAPGGVAVTDGVHTVAGATSIDMANAVVSGTTPNAIVTPNKASASQFGIVEVDGTSITSDGGVISDAAGGLPFGQEGDLAYYHHGAWTRLPIGPSGQAIVSTGTDPAYTAQRIAMAVATVVQGTRHELDIASSDGTIAVSATDDSGADAVHYNLSVPPAGGTGAGVTVIWQEVNNDPLGKCLSLWNGSSNNAPPSNWQTSAFDDSSWPATVEAYTGSGPTGDWASRYPASSTEIVLWRQHFALPAGTVTSATMYFSPGSTGLNGYINGVAITPFPGSGNPSAPDPINISEMITGGDNVVAIETQAGSPPAGIYAWIGFVVTTTMGAVGPSGGSGGTLPAGTEGDILYYHSGAWKGLHIGTSGDILTSNGTDPVYGALPSVAAGQMLTGSVSITISAGNADNTASVSFGVTFGSAPIVLATSSDADLIASAESITTTGFTARLRANVPLAPGTSVTAALSWMAAGAGSGGSTGTAMTQINSQTLGSDIATVSFTSIGGSYNHLKLVIQARGTKASIDAAVHMRINSDTGSNYDLIQIQGFQGSITAGENRGITSAIIAHISAANSTTGDASNVEMTIPNYAGTTFRKGWVVLNHEQQDEATTDIVMWCFGGQWRGTAAITRIDLFCDTGNFKAGSVLSLYGIT